MGKSRHPKGGGQTSTDINNNTTTIIIKFIYICFTGDDETLLHHYYHTCGYIFLIQILIFCNLQHFSWLKRKWPLTECTLPSNTSPRTTDHRMFSLGSVHYMDSIFGLCRTVIIPPLLSAVASPTY